MSTNDLQNPSSVSSPKSDDASNVLALVTMTTALIAQRADATEFKGAAKARASQATKDQAAVILAAILSEPCLRSARCAVRVKSVLRGQESLQVVTVSCIDIVRAVAFGGAVVGSARLA